jgi:ferredoxin-NADP reductase/Na+-translocating ferredoxin:NAD+ oxidoreductase RnfD subunit
MYRTVTLALTFLAIIATIFGFLGIVPYSGFEQTISIAIALSTALLVNWLCSLLWRTSVNMESAVITALILHFLVIPATLADISGSWIIATVVAFAVVSKFVFAWRKQHIVNPAATGLVLLALLYAVFDLPGYFESTWWVGRPELFIPLLLAGAAVVVKVRKWVPVLSFLLVALVIFLIEEYQFAGTISNTALGNFWLSGPSLFLAFFMLTEPFTMPPTKRLQAGYGALVGFFSQTTLFLSVGIKMTPELALILGNVLFYPATLKQKLILPLAKVNEVAKDTYEFAFQKPLTLRFRAGQYLEWMLPHKDADNRGIRRYFTIASAPSDPLLRITVRIGEGCSSFKRALKRLKTGDEIIASQLAGDFVLPADSSKVAMVAGGIGITPFLSQIDHMQVGNVHRHDATLFYCNNTVAEIAYQDRLQAAVAAMPFRLVHVIAKENIQPYEFGYLTAEIIKKHTPDYLERIWYLSGPPGMVNAYSKLLRAMGVKRRNIRKDFFPGLA